MKNKKIAYVLGIALLLSTLVLFVPIQPTKAQFVLAYTFASGNNGNAISFINAYFDGDFEASVYNDPDIYPTITYSSTLEVNASTVISLRVGCWLNSTYADVSSLAEGQTVIRHSVSVLSGNGSVVFSKQNFTYQSGVDALTPMYHYDYDVTLDFVPLSGTTYTVTVIYEVYGE